MSLCMAQSSPATESWLGPPICNDVSCMVLLGGRQWGFTVLELGLVPSLLPKVDSWGSFSSWESLDACDMVSRPLQCVGRLTDLVSLIQNHDLRVIVR